LAIWKLESERERIPDVGSVGSKLTIELSLGYEVYALDTRKYALEHPCMDFIFGDITKTPFRDNSFDKVTAILKATAKRLRKSIAFLRKAVKHQSLSHLVGLAPYICTEFMISTG
jgi:hypothetical protein